MEWERDGDGMGERWMMEWGRDGDGMGERWGEILIKVRVKVDSLILDSCISITDSIRPFNSAPPPPPPP